MTIERLTLEQPPAQEEAPGVNNGGLNSSVSAGAIMFNVPLAANGTINVEFILGAMQNGSFRFLVNVEALPNTTTSTPDATKAGAVGKASSSGRRKAGNR